MSASSFPSMPLARIVGEQLTSHGEILSKLLRYIDAQKLRDPADTRTIMLDAELMAVFGRQRMTMSEIEREIGRHIV